MRAGRWPTRFTHKRPTCYPQVVPPRRLALPLNRHYRVARGRQNPTYGVKQAKRTQTSKKASKLIRAGFRPARARIEGEGTSPQRPRLRRLTLILLKPSSSAGAKRITLHLVF